MIDKEKIEEGVNEYYPYLEGKEMIHPINYQRAKQRDAFLTGVKWALEQVENNSVLDDVKAGALDCLKQISDPIAHIKKQANSKGLEVHDLAAFYLSRDVEYIKSIASKFIEKHEL